MQTFRVRVPTQVYRVNKCAPVCSAATTAAAATPARSMSLFPRFINNEFAQVARLLDDMSQFQQQATRSNYGFPFAPSSFRSFQPRFDVKEGKDAYELTGELPGCTDINVEFTDASTLTIRGRSSHSREEGSRPAGLVQGGQAEQAQLATAEAAQAPATEPNNTATADSETGSTYHKASVEDENAAADSTEDYVDVSEAVATPATEAPSDTVQAEQSTPPQQQQQEQQQPQSKYWVSERSIGEFARTFTFPARVDQDAVRASLKDGILSVVVPKAAKATRKITVE